MPNFPVNPGDSGYAATGAIGGPEDRDLNCLDGLAGTLPNLLIQ